ncbi:MAG TPA: cytochrome D1 domain-containing protein [Solirubrobacteraceae bacterium]|nr:cytochrome D1 domain-containing protein [Solirubrobacteraceae bacterium]
MIDLRATASAAAIASLLSGLAGCGGRGRSGDVAAVDRRAPSVAAPAAPTVRPVRPALPRPPRPRRRHTHALDVYAADRASRLSPVVRRFPSRIYVPNSTSNTVDVIDPLRMKVVRHFAVGAEPQHVTPSYDLRTLWVDADHGNSLTPIDPRTGRRGKDVPVEDPYNLYFTPGGRYAIVVAEAKQRLDFRDAHSMRLHHALHVGCNGVDHMDFSASGRSLIASCEFGGTMIRVNVARQRVTGTLELGAGSMPQDVKLAPDGSVFYVADQAAGGVHVIDARRFRVIGLIPTGAGAHGLYASRDSRFLYVSNRTAGTVSVISFARRRVARTWRIPNGSPDMGGISTDGRVLWLSGRYNGEVYAISTRTGELLKRIKVGAGPHGLCVYPQPGRYSLGHTGVFR